MINYNNVISECYIGYHGTQIDAAQSIINGGFRVWKGHEGDNNINPLSNEQYNICGRGVYCSPIIKKMKSRAKKLRFKIKTSFLLLCAELIHINLGFVKNTINLWRQFRWFECKEIWFWNKSFSNSIEAKILKINVFLKKYSNKNLFKFFLIIHIHFYFLKYF